MSRNRISLIHYDVLRELCDNCRREKFHFVPTGAPPAEAGRCAHCGGQREMADLSDTSIRRLVTRGDSEIAIVPRDE